MGSGAVKEVVIAEVKHAEDLVRRREPAEVTVAAPAPAMAAATKAADDGHLAVPHAPPKLNRSQSSSKAWCTLYEHVNTPAVKASSKGMAAPFKMSPEDIAMVTLCCQECGNGKLSPAQTVDMLGMEFTREDGLAAVNFLRCLEIRRKYVEDFEPRHREADTAQYGHKEVHKHKCTEALAAFDGESTLAMRKGEGRRIVWDPFSGTPPAKEQGLVLAFEDGVYGVHDSKASNAPIYQGVEVEEFCRDYVTVLNTMRDRGCVSYAEPRLRELDLRFQLHTHRNANRESRLQRESAGRDWYQVRKVDTHIHHSACFSQRTLMKFIRRKMREEMDSVVMEEAGKKLTLREVFGTIGVSEEDDVNADRLCCMASIGNGQHDTFGRFDVFNTKYNPFGEKRLRDIFLKTDNYIEGRFLAELTKEVMDGYRTQKFVCAEWRISIYGKSKDEWKKLAKWFRSHDIKCDQVRWLIQVPRLYPIFRKMGTVRNFADMLANIFEPLFQASLDPQAHEDMFYMLQQIVGIDSVDDESQGTNLTVSDYPSPEDWNSETNPPYTYWMYHMYANIRSLNVLRERMGLNTLRFRPHCGEAGNVSHLCSGFMLADGICHGVQLKESPVLQYLYYLSQIGLAVSPLSNDILFIPLDESPFGVLFRRGLNVSLSTDDPLIIHLTEDALIEEYVVAARTFRLSNCDMCEIARNSVLQSGFEQKFKDWWIGTRDSPDEQKSNVPSMRLAFRKTCLQQEMFVLSEAAKAAAQ